MVVEVMMVVAIKCFDSPLSSVVVNVRDDQLLHACMFFEGLVGEGLHIVTVKNPKKYKSSRDNELIAQLANK